MPLPKGYLPRKGDEVLIRARMRRDARIGDPHVECSLEIVGQEYSSGIFLSCAEIHSLHARKWNEGDRVQNSAGWGEVIAVHEDQVWVKMCSPIDMAGLMITSDANKLEPYVKPDAIDMVALGIDVALSYPPEPPCGGRLGSQSVVGDDDPIAARDEAANR